MLGSRQRLGHRMQVKAYWKNGTTPMPIIPSFLTHYYEEERGHALGSAESLVDGSGHQWT